MGWVTLSLKMSEGSAAHFVLCSQLCHSGVTQSLLAALCWGAVTSPGALWSSTLICSHDLYPWVSSSVAVKLLTELGKWLQCL